jgi:hypothetical protein
MATKENTCDYAKLEVNVGELSIGTKGNTKTGTASAGAVTYSGLTGVITTEALTTAQDASYTLTITDDQILATDVVLVSVANGTNTQGTTVVTKVTPAAGSLVIIVTNKHATAQALNGTLKIAFAAIRNT